MPSARSRKLAPVIGRFFFSRSNTTDQDRRSPNSSSPQGRAADHRMQLRQQIIQDHTDSLAGHLSIDANMAFLRLAHSLVTGKSVHMFDPADLVEGGDDKRLT